MTFPQVRALAADESAYKPGSVSRRTTEVVCRPGDHPSRVAVADNLMRPTRELGRAALERSLSDLAPGGVYQAAQVTLSAGGLLHHRFTLAAGCPVAVSSLWHFPAGHPGWALPTTLPCGARTFLGEQPKGHPTRSPGRLVRRTEQGTGDQASANRTERDSTSALSSRTRTASPSGRLPSQLARTAGSASCTVPPPLGLTSMTAAANV
jgi:hypothetical protein